MSVAYLRGRARGAECPPDGPVTKKKEKRKGKKERKREGEKEK